MPAQRFRSYTAQAAIDPFLIVKPGTADGTVTLATAPADLLIGTSDALAKAVGESVDVGTGDLHEVRLGGAVTRGQPLTTNAASKAVTAAPAAGANVRIIGFADQSGVADDVITYIRSPGYMQG